MNVLIRLVLLFAVIYVTGRLVRRVLGERKAQAPVMFGPITGQATLVEPWVSPRATVLVAAAGALLSLLSPWYVGWLGAHSALDPGAMLLLLLLWAYPVVCAWRGRAMRPWLARACAVLAFLAGLLMLLGIVSDRFLFLQSRPTLGGLGHLICSIVLIQGVSRYTRPPASTMRATPSF